MKKLLSVFMCLSILILTVCAAPISSDAAQYKPNTKIYADAYMLINLDDDSHPVVAQKNQDKVKFPASLTKIVTTIVVLEKIDDLSATTTVSRQAIEALYGTDAQVAGLKIGDEVTIEQLLYLTMVHSACDACQVLAECVGGSVPEFCKMMNDWAKSIGCTNTNFVNPDGLHDDNHYTTASDLAKITLKALENETFYKIATTQQYVYNDYTYVHTNLMLNRFYVTYYYPYAQGIKTGSTDEAGFCLITMASKNGYNYLAIVLDSPIKHLDGYDTKCSFIDCKSLFEWAFNYLKYSTVVRQNDVISEVPISSGKDADTVQLVAEKDVTTLVPTALDPSAVVIEPIDPPAQLEAPVTKGDKICKAKVIYAGKTVAKVQLVAGQTVELSTFLRIITSIKRFFSSKAVLVILGVFVVGIIGYACLFVFKLSRDKKRRAERRAKQAELDRELYNFENYLPPDKK